MTSDNGVKTLLTPFLDRIDRRWGHYCQENRQVISELYKAGLLIDLRGIETRIKTRRKRKNRYVDAIIEAGKNNTLVFISKDYYPRGNRISLFKKESLLKIPRSTDKDVRKALLEKIRRYKSNGICVGYDWEGGDSHSKEFRVTSIEDCFRADRMNEELNRNNTPLKVRVYPGNPENRGIHAVVYDVPSWSSDETYDVHIYHVAAYAHGRDSEKIRKLSFNFKSSHGNCVKAAWSEVKDSRKPSKDDINQKPRQGDEFYQDHHVALAVKQAKRHIVGGVVDPFLERKDIRFGNRFYNGLDNVVVETRTPNGPRRALAVHFEREDSLWDLIDKNNLERLKNNHYSVTN